MSETGLIAGGGGKSVEQGFYTMILQSAEAMKQIDDLAESFCASGTYGLKNVGDAKAMIMAYMSTNATFHKFFLENHIIEGRPCRRAEFMLAEFMRLSGKVTWKDRTKKCASATFEFGGQSYDEEFTIQDAVRMVGEDKLKNTKSNWYKDPAAMLRWRLLSRALRYICPAATGGFYTPEEVQDIEITSKPAVANSEEAIKARRKEHGIDDSDDEIVDAEVVTPTETPADPEPEPEPKPVAKEEPAPAPAADQEQIWELQGEILAIGKDRLSLLQDQIMSTISKMSGKDVQELSLEETTGIRDKFLALAVEQGV